MAIGISSRFFKDISRKPDYKVTYLVNSSTIVERVFKVWLKERVIRVENLTFADANKEYEMTESVIDSIDKISDFEDEVFVEDFKNWYKKQEFLNACEDNNEKAS